MNVLAQIHYIPIHKMPYYEDKYGEQKFEIAELYYDKCISLLIYPGLSVKDQLHVINSIKSFYE